MGKGINMEFKAITTQEELDNVIKDRLARQKETIESQYQDYEEIKKRKEELETEVGVLNATIKTTNDKYANHDTEISNLNAKLKDYEISNMRTKVALQHGIPFDLASRLVGEDEESLIKDAEKLASLVKQKEPIAPLKNIEPQVDEKDAAYKSLLENLNLEGE
jgi:septal ring factor EnvC (AmiA/AmiB activator)